MNSRNLLSEQLADLMPHSEEVKDALADAVAADAYVGKCPKCGKDLQIRASQKTRGMFIGCAGWPDCDVTYPLPKGKIESMEELCPTCGMPQVKVTAFRSKPRVICIDPNCETNKEPDVVVGECPVCKAAGKQAKLIAQKNPRTLKRFIRCENHDDCSWPVEALSELRLPGQGAGRRGEGGVEGEEDRCEEACLKEGGDEQGCGQEALDPQGVIEDGGEIALCPRRRARRRRPALKSNLSLGRGQVRSLRQRRR